MFLAGLRLHSADRPNVIFILTDDQRSDSLGCYGNAVVKTPHIDRLAAEGVLFANAFVTSAICAPSRASYFLGQYERRHGYNFNSGTALSPEAWDASYPVLLKESGYYTGYVGKNHVAVGPKGYFSGIMEPTFDFWYGGHEYLFFYPKNHHEIFRQAKADTQVEIVGEGAVSFIKGDDFIAGAKAFLENRPTDRPFCLTVALNVPHAHGITTMQMKPTDPELYRTAYRDQLEAIPLPETYVAAADIQTPKLPESVYGAKYRQKIYEYVNEPATLREFKLRQYQTITGVDRMVGQLRVALEEAGIGDNTIIIFTSDHGKMEGEFGLGGKALNYDACLRVPLIIMDPRQPADRRGRRETRIALSVDLAPSLMEMAGLARPASMQGASLVPLLEGRQVDWRQYAFAENFWSTYHGNPRCETVQSTKWKYTRYFANDRTVVPTGVAGIKPEEAAAYRRWLSSSILGERPDHEELFDLVRDPAETTNLADDPGSAAVLQRLRQEMERAVRLARGSVDEEPKTMMLDPAEQISLRTEYRAKAAARARD